MFDSIVDKIYQYETAFERIKLFFESGVNIFDTKMLYIDVFVVILIIILYVGYTFKVLDSSGERKNWIEFIIRSVLIFIIISFIGGKYIDTNHNKVIEGDAYTHYFFTKNLAEETNGFLTTSYIYNNNLLIEGIGNNNNKKKQIVDIGGFIEGDENFYISQEDVIVDFKELDYSNSFSGGNTGLFNYFENISEKKEKYGIVSSLDDESYVVNNSSKGVKKMINCINEGKDNCINFHHLFYGDIVEEGFKGNYTYRTEYGLTSGAIKKTGIDISKFGSINTTGVVKSNEDILYIVNYEDLWVWRIMKVDRTDFNNIKLSFYIIPNPDMMKLDKNKNNSYSGLMKNVFDEYRTLKIDTCAGVENCTFEDIYKRKVRVYAKDDVKSFLSAFSIINYGFNSRIDDAANRVSVKINGDNYYSFVGFNEWLIDKGSRTYSLGNNTIGSNFYNNKYLIQYVMYNEEEEKKTNLSYPLGLYNDNSFYKNFYGGVSSDLEIGVKGNIILILLKLVYGIVLVISSLFYVYLSKQFLE